MTERLPDGSQEGIRYYGPVDQANPSYEDLIRLSSFTPVSLSDAYFNFHLPIRRFYREPSNTYDQRKIWPEQVDNPDSYLGWHVERLFPASLIEQVPQASITIPYCVTAENSERTILPLLSMIQDAARQRSPLEVLIWSNTILSPDCSDVKQTAERSLEAYRALIDSIRHSAALTLEHCVLPVTTT
jgi:hypothetical protein